MPSSPYTAWTIPKCAALSRWLHEQPEVKGLTIRDLSEIIGKPHSYLGRIEQAQQGLDMLEFIDLCGWTVLRYIQH